MALIRSSWCELAQLVTDHVFGDKYWNVLASIVNRKRMSDHVWDDR